VGSKMFERRDDLISQTFSTLTAPLGQPSEREQSGGGAARGTDHAPAVQQSLFLHLCVVEVAEYSVHFLQRADDAVQIRGIVERRRDVDQIAQLFRVNADVVESGG